MSEEQVIAARALVDYANDGFDGGMQVSFLIAEHEAPLSVTSAAFDRNIARLTTENGTHYIAFSALQGVLVRAPVKSRAKIL